ncbi:hypothetical protein JCM33374_g6041 [Metschnikowia sp. JCM 33374]|nr:hypothetical protein JCM33374_g6041 [Metschnikowia sp. JCM 33374]
MMNILALSPSVQSMQQSDQASMKSAASSRKPSRLSGIMPRRGFAPPKAHGSDGTPLTRVSSNQSLQSTKTTFSGYFGNYKLSRVETQSTVEPDFAFPSKYKVSLNLSAKEISLLRYMWNKMLSEESTAQDGPSSSLPIPGSLWAQSDKPLPALGSSRKAFGASSTFCSQLYSNLLSMDPDLETAFPSLQHQAVSMAGVLTLAVNSLENLAYLDDYLVELGNRHSRILGIESAQFELMGEAFIKTFHDRFGTRFTHELQLLWIKFYMYLANSMLQFGLDPVMKIPGAHDPFDSVSISTASIYSSESENEVETETEVISMENSVRRPSTGTDLSSLTSGAVKPRSKTGSRQGSGGSSSHASALPPVPQDESQDELQEASDNVSQTDSHTVSKSSSKRSSKRSSKTSSKTSWPTVLAASKNSQLGRKKKTRSKGDRTDGECTIM